MAATTQPISIASTSNSQAHHNVWASPSASGSISNSMGIHPAPIFAAGSLGSASMRSATSFGSKLFSNSPGQYIHTLDPNVYKCRISSSVESDRASRIMAMNSEVARKEDELCRNYNCCGLDITDLHALLEHFEEAHVFIFDSIAQGVPLANYLPPPPPSSSALLTQTDGQTTPPASGSSAPNVEGESLLSAPTPVRSTDSALAGALGAHMPTPLPSPLSTTFSAAASASPPSSSSLPTPVSSSSSSMDDSYIALKAEQHDDMDIGMELDFDLDYDMPDSSGSSNGSSPEAEQALHSFQQNFSSMPSTSNTSTSSFSTLGGALGLAPPAQHNLSKMNASSVISSPPDTPLLATPVSPAGAFGLNNIYNGNTSGVWGADGALMSSVSQQQQALSNNMASQPKGPSAFDSIHLHLPPKNGLQFGGASRNGLGLSSHAFFSQGGQFHPSAAYPFGSSQQQLLMHQQQRLHNIYLHSGNPRNTSTPINALNAHGAYATSEYARAQQGSGQNTFGGMGQSAGQAHGQGNAIPPSLLFGNGSSSSAWNTPMTTPAQSRASSPNSGVVKKEGKGSVASGSLLAPTSGATSSSSAATSSSTSAGGATGSFNGAGPSGSGSGAMTLTSPLPLLMQKPFKCPKPGCMKSYKQANGLKYHLTHGQCLFTPSAELVALSEEGLTEREAERKLRPYCCQVPPCQRRYKNMNGLRYHYQHSGEHGQVGLTLLASGNHDATKSHPSPPMVTLDTDSVPLSPTTSSNTSQPMMNFSATKSQSQRSSPTNSAPPTPTSAVHRMPQRKFIINIGQGQNGSGTAAMGMSQPPSAYASPWASPAPTRSGSPQTQQGQVQNQQQNQVYGALSAQASNMMFQQHQQQNRVEASWI